MRSKSEVLIAERLYAYGIPFRYEQQILVKDRNFSPDFTFEDANAEEFYLEYCGMMDVPEYVESFQKRRAWYESVGIAEWSNMIYLFEVNNEVDMYAVDRMIQEKIIPRL